MSRIMGPLRADTYLLALTCPGCRKQFRAGDYVAVVPIGDDPGVPARCRTHNAITIHWACITGVEDAKRLE